jgi:F0F1-type ATP synthase assembly protein I
VKRPSEPSTWLQQAGLLTSIPFVLLVGPAIGYYLGSLIDRRWSVEPWGIGLGIAFGFAASARVTFQMIREAQHIAQDTHHKDD